MEVFEQLIYELLNNVEQYVRLPQGVQYNDDTIKNVDADFVVEVGDIKKQIHAHIMLKFKHHTRIQLNFQKIKEFFKKQLQLKNVYMQAKLLRPSASDNIIDYLNKMT
jgi:carbon monoxide dehydrogenase subunit G